MDLLSALRRLFPNPLTSGLKAIGQGGLVLVVNCIRSVCSNLTLAMDGLSAPISVLDTDLYKVRVGVM